MASKTRVEGSGITYGVMLIEIGPVPVNLKPVTKAFGSSGSNPSFGSIPLMLNVLTPPEGKS